MLRWLLPLAHRRFVACFSAWLVGPAVEIIRALVFPITSAPKRKAPGSAGRRSRLTVKQFVRASVLAASGCLLFLLMLRTRIPLLRWLQPPNPALSWQWSSFLPPAALILLRPTCVTDLSARATTLLSRTIRSRSVTLFKRVGERNGLVLHQLISNFIASETAGELVPKTNVNVTSELAR